MFHMDSQPILIHIFFRTITDVLALRKAWDKVKGKLQNGQALKGRSNFKPYIEAIVKI